MLSPEKRGLCKREKNKTGFIKKKRFRCLVAKQSKQDMTKLLGEKRKLSFLSHYTEATSA